MSRPGRPAGPAGESSKDEPWPAEDDSPGAGSWSEDSWIRDGPNGHRAVNGTARPQGAAAWLEDLRREEEHRHEPPPPPEPPRWPDRPQSPHHPGYETLTPGPRHAAESEPAEEPPDTWPDQAGIQAWPLDAPGPVEPPQPWQQQDRAVADQGWTEDRRGSGSVPAWPLDAPGLVEPPQPWQQDRGVAGRGWAGDRPGSGSVPAWPLDAPGPVEPPQPLPVVPHEDYGPVWVDPEAQAERDARLRAQGVLPPHPPRAVLRRRRTRRRLLEWPFLVVFALLSAFLIRTFAVQTFYIPSGSMHQTLLEGDRVLVNKLGYHLHAVHRGDVVVFRRPPNFPVHDDDLIKRVVALPGETVEAHNGQVFVNRRPLTEPYVDPTCNGTEDFRPTKVATGHLWMMGDNRCDSSDSRVFGAIDEHLVVGRAFVLVWPPGRLGWL